MRELIETKFIPYLCFILGVAICTSTSLMSIAYTLLVVLVLFKQGAWKDLKKALQTPYIVAMLIFYLVFVLGILWSVAPTHSITAMLFRMIGYLLAPLFYIAYQTKNSATLLIKGFIIGALLSSTLSIVSFALQHRMLIGTRDGAWVLFHGHLIHNAFLAIASSFLLWGIFNQNYSRDKRLWVLLAYLVCFIDVMFVVNGRTGQLMTLAMNAFVLVCRFKLRGILVIFVATLVITPFLWFSPVIQKGLKDYHYDITQYNNGNHWTSFGARKEFHRLSEKFIKAKPILGYGTGSFGKIYKDEIGNMREPLTTNPHRDVLWIGVETGAIGIIAFVYMLFCLAKTFLRFNPYYRYMGLALIFGYAFASIENSFFIDNVTGMAFIFIILALAVSGSIDKSSKPV